MGKHHKGPKNSSNPPKTSNGLGSFGGFNIGDLLKNIDLNQVISLLSSFVGAKDMNTNQLSSILRNMDLSDMSKEGNSSKIDINKMQSQLSLLADRLDQIDGGKNSNVHDELLNAVKNIQGTPGGTDAVMDFIKSNLSSSDEDDNTKHRK